MNLVIIPQFLFVNQESNTHKNPEIMWCNFIN